MQPSRGTTWALPTQGSHRLGEARPWVSGSAGFPLKGDIKKLTLGQFFRIFGTEITAFSEGSTFRHPCCSHGQRVAVSACGSAAPRDGDCDKSHLLMLQRCSAPLLQYRLLPLSAANPGRSSKAEAVTQLQNTLSVPLTELWRAPLSKPLPRLPARLAARLSGTVAFAPHLFWFSSLWL